jgi:hypothetical protein
MPGEWSAAASAAGAPPSTETEEASVETSTITDRNSPQPATPADGALSPITTMIALVIAAKRWTR